ncbi:hypothetical protein [Snodgrassella sp. ESL0253]|uniref:hypothetical protein n=1 Tax=Snodgrassella sp. ESL0253 TaxID=2705031 RepID=UPI001582B07F|nr:hypothetical protein [Snodgrassella sp. ESL0253]NUE66133.1 hypothetical protein [Snodgrassella sp. ESL0253]
MLLLLRFIMRISFAVYMAWLILFLSMAGKYGALDISAIRCLLELWGGFLTLSFCCFMG